MRKTVLLTVLLCAIMVIDSCQTHFTNDGTQNGSTGLPAVSARSAETIGNGGLQVTVDVASQSLRIADTAVGEPLAVRGEFPRRFEKVTGGSVDDPVWGHGQELRVAHVGGFTTIIRLFDGLPFVQLRAVASNAGREPLTMARLDVARFHYEIGVPIDAVRTLGTGGLDGVDAPGSYAFLAAADPETRRGVVFGWLTHEHGLGAFLPERIRGKAGVTARLDFGHFVTAPGANRPTDTMVVGLFGDARLGLEAYADAVAKQYHIELPPQPSVYCTWYHAGASDEKRMASTTEFAAERLKPFGLGVMQIDDGWQAIVPKGFSYKGKIRLTGPVKVFVDSNEKYPSGMAHTAEMVASHGMTAGIWFMPFAGNFRNPYFDADLFAKTPDGKPFHDERWSGTCLDLSNPKTQAFVAERVKRIHDWGFRYFKLDGLHTGAPSYNIYIQETYRKDAIPDSRLHDPNMTPVEAYRKGLEIVRQNAPDTFLLGCNVSQNMVSMGPAFGLLDAMRIGPDNGSAGGGTWRDVTAGARHGSTLYFLNGRVWYNDPDPVYVRGSNPIDKARWMCSWVAISGSMLTASEQFSDLPPERLDLLKRTMPASGLFGRPVDLFDAPSPRIWLLTDTRRPVRRDVIGLFNWNEKSPCEIVYDMGKAGLDPTIAYEAFDFWENRLLDPIRGQLRQTLPAATCRVLALRPAADHPELLSSSRHIAQCMVDVLDEQWDAASKTLRGTSQVVAGDPYELRIVLPSAGKAYRVRGATAKSGADEIRADVEIDGRLVRLRFEATREGAYPWRVQFDG